ncbi:helix-turn-helix domain-containing protein [Mycolicibacterium neoaurum]|uniref:TetR/AcrR family transcriptional regulator n=1 Tax=Mycolicibacterium neoaurum TaxID=1795 RepID=UPI002673C6FA|nr:TetR/AcrR family transcriptional regulator [Mycolicibacterium neoaurum]MDO3402776.1 helix-turn-helix domain-containing protein [Mycolicibacterium neoaurum]
MADVPDTGGSKRAKRSPETVRRLLLQSALELFAGRGYSGTTTREVAARAKVSEALLFRHFGTKVTLFEHAVINPFAQYLNDYVDRWTRHPAASAEVEEITADYVGGLYDLLRAHRELVVALVAAHAHEAQLDSTITNALVGPIKRVEQLTAREALARNYGAMDPRLATRSFLAMVMGMAVLDELFDGPDRPRPPRDAVVGEMTALLVHGIEGRSAATQTVVTAPRRRRAR